MSIEYVSAFVIILMTLYLNQLQIEANRREFDTTINHRPKIGIFVVD